MTDDVKREYRYLDGEAERQALVEDIRRVRREVVQVAELVPQDKWYEPRYHGWSLAAMLGHLHLMDTLSLRLMQLALIGLRVPIPIELLNQLNDLVAGVFRQRVVTTTLRGIEKNEKNIADFILRLPIDRFTRTVYHPALGTYLTLEQAMQEFFYRHWQHHLQTLRQAEDVHYEPPAQSSEV